MNKRQEKLKEIILALHNGMNLEDAIKEFRKHFDSVTTKEITDMEHALIKEEGITTDQIQNLCDVHAAVFEGSIEDIHRLEGYYEKEGHPAQVFLEENERIEKLIDEEIKPYLNKNDKTSLLMLRIGYDRLSQIDNHYKRKENLFFPKLERVGITAPPQVMWGVDDEIRNEIREIIQILSQKEIDIKDLNDKINKNITRIIDMIFKENNILMPLIIEHMTHFDWILADSSSDEFGYFIKRNSKSWILEDEEIVEEENIKDLLKNVVPLSAGSLSFEEVDAILNSLPLDMTFVDKNGHVKYFTQGKERIFPRPLTVIGRHVSMCHPPQSVDLVDQIINDFKTGIKDTDEFWIDFGEMFVHIRYFAVRDKDNNYLGTLEMSQDIKPLKMLKGEKRLR